MMLVEVLVALLVAALLATLFLPATRWARQGAGGTGFAWALLAFFTVVFLAALAGGAWLPPVGPAIYGVHWAVFLFTGLLAALLIAAASHPVTAQEGGDTVVAGSPALLVLILLLVLAVLGAWLTRWVW